MSRGILIASCAALLFTAGAVRADDLVWWTDFEKAREVARAERKMILVDFTGSDWCGWCMKLVDEVFCQPEFADYAARHLVLLEVDFPKRKAQSKEQKEANRALRQRFAVKGYPTVLLLDDRGEVVLRTGYEPGGAPAFVKRLEAARRSRR